MTLPVNYRPDFDRLWKCFIETERRGLGARGRRKQAKEQFGKMIVTEIVFRNMIEGLRIQARAKQDEKRAGRRFTPFQHAFRWLRNESWKDLPVEVVEETRMQEIFAKHADRSWAD